METAKKETKSTSLSELRKESEKRFDFLAFCHRHFPFLFEPHSLFYFFWIIFFLGIFWCFYSLVTNGFTQLYNWDYTWQYVPIGYYTHDVWTNFFKTGHFDMYSGETFMGADSFGSNAYYGLFDPFVIWMVIFPRSWVPQLFAISACIKGAVGALCMRAYLRYRGVSETPSRLGAAAYAFSGFFNFMVGFPDVVSAVVFLPLILLGIEKVLKEGKINHLAIGLFLVGLVNFFYIVVYCVFGVLYAIWRYFSTFKERKGWKRQLSTMGIGVLGFAIGLMMCSFVLMPSLRNSALSGRTDSIGQAYLNYLIDSLSKADFGSFFGTVFSMVGENPGRELMALVSFFFPTVNYSYLPMVVPTGGSYDAWTASIFCYTPIMIFFIYGLIGAIRRKEWVTLAGFGLCSIAAFTTFSYFFFYVFSGDGYGRWLVVLVPLIIYVATKEMDRLKENPEWQLLSASGVAIFMTVLTIVICHLALDGKRFDSGNNLTYYPHSFIPVSSGATIYLVVYQVILLLVEVVLIYYFHNKKFFPKMVFAFIALETIVSGNLSFFYGGLWNYRTSFEGGIANHSAAQRAIDTINAEDDSFYRVYSDYFNVKNDGLTYGYNGASHFHSLFNYDLVDFARMTGLTHNESSPVETYGGYTYTNKVWSAAYNNKRLGFDMVTGHKYYVLRNEGYYNFKEPDFAGINVPFGSTLVDMTDDYRIYESGLYLGLGHAVDGLYQMNRVEDGTPNENDFYHVGGSSMPTVLSTLRNDHLFLTSAVVEDEDVDRLPEGENFAILNQEETSSIPGYQDFGYQKLSTKMEYYVTTEEYGGYHPSDPGLFLHDSSYWAEEPKRITSKDEVYMTPDHGKIVYSPSNGTYFNDSDGAYIAMYYPAARKSGSLQGSNRIYLIGDKLDEEGNIIVENTLLSYEYRALSSYRTGADQGLPIFGLYAEGKVKNIVMCPKDASWRDALGPWKTTTIDFYMLEKDEVDEMVDLYSSKDYALQNVVRPNNDTFYFDTSYSEPKMVVTTLGYDVGWNIKAYDQEKNPIEGVEIYKLDGGLVGFNAPAGEVSYELYYITPTLEFTVPLSVVGITLLLGFDLGLFVLEYRHKAKKAQSLGNSK